MTPLVLLLMLGFLMVIAASLMIWAALTLGDARRRGTPTAAAARPAPRRGAAGAAAAEREQPVWRRDARAVGNDVQTVPAGTGQGSADTGSTRPARPSNDEVRGARAVVTPRATHDDAFDRFLEKETKDRGFPPLRTDERRGG